MAQFRTYGAGIPLLLMSLHFCGSLEPWKGKRKPPQVVRTPGAAEADERLGALLFFFMVAHSSADFKAVIKPQWATISFDL